MTNIDRAGQRRGWLATATGTLVLLLLSGCATVQQDARFPEMREAASSRLNQNVVWNRDSEQDRQAQEAVRRLLAQELSADAAVQVALLNNRNLQATYESLGIAQADLIEAGLLQNPVFSLTVESGSPGTNIEAAVVQDFIGIFSLSARKKIGQVAAERITLEAAQRVLDLAREVQAQYYTVVGDAQALELARQVVVATGAAAELAERQREAGNLSRRDQNIQQSFYAQTVLEVARAEAQLTNDRERLNRLMGLWGQHTRWKTPIRLPAIPDSLPSADQVEARAISQRLDLASAKKEAENAAQIVGLTRKFRYLGLFGLGIAFKREPGSDQLVGPTVEFGLPIFNQGQARVARADAEFKRSQERVTALAIEIRSEAREARNRLTAAHEAVRHYQQALLPLQQTIMKETLKFYNGMLLGVYDLLLAQQNQVQTARQYVAANKEFWLAWTDLERALGGRISPAAAAGTAEPPSAPPTENDRDAPADNPHQHGDKQS